MTNAARYSAKGPELLLDLVEKAADILKSHGGLSAEGADELALAIANSFADTWNGQTVYIPKGNWNGGSLRWFELQRRDMRIYREYNGTNRQEICDRYAISPQRLYQIITSVRRYRNSARISAPVAGPDRSSTL